MQRPNPTSRFERESATRTHFTPPRDSMEPSHNWYCTSLENWRPRGCVGSSPTGSAQALRCVHIWELFSSQSDMFQLGPNA